MKNNNKKENNNNNNQVIQTQAIIIEIRPMDEQIKKLYEKNNANKMLIIFFIPSVFFLSLFSLLQNMYKKKLKIYKTKSTNDRN